MDQPDGRERVGAEERVAPGVSVRKGRGRGLGSIRIAFMFRGVECRERLRLDPTPPNVRYAVRLRGEVLNAIERGTFNYLDFFPESENAKRFGFVPSGELVGDALRTWFGARRRGLAASTALTYQRVIDGYLVPWFGKTRLRDLSPPMIRAKALELADESRAGESREPVTLKTARNVLTPLGSMLEAAVGDGKIDANPMARVKLEKYWPAEHITSDFEADPFTFAEMTAIFEACAGGAQEEEADYWRFAFGTGLRPSEQIIVNWPCVDLVQHRIRVERARVTGAAAPREGGPKSEGVVKGPKTRAGKRDVDFTTGAWEALQRQQGRTRLAGAEVWRDVRTLAPWTREEAIRKRFVAILKKAGVRYRNPYQTRHTFASNLLAAGFPELWVAKQMGHTTVEMCRRNYGKWIDQGSDPQTRVALAAFFKHVSPAVAALSAWG